MKNKEFDKEKFTKEVAEHLKAIAELCEENEIEQLNLCAINGYYSFFSNNPKVEFSAYTDKRKQQEAEFEEKMKIYSELGIPMDRNIEDYDCECEDDWKDYEECGGAENV